MVNDAFTAIGGIGLLTGCESWRSLRAAGDQPDGTAVLFNVTYQLTLAQAALWYIMATPTKAR